MKRTRIFTLLIIIAVALTACTSSEAAYQPQPGVASTPVPPVGATALPGSTVAGVVVSTAVASSIGAIQGYPAVTSVPDTARLTPVPIPADGITPADNNRVFIMHPGERFLLNLGNSIYEWTVTVDNQAVLSRVVNITVIKGAQGVYEAHQPGQVILMATGDAPCRRSKPPCMLPSMMFQVTIQVQG